MGYDLSDSLDIQGPLKALKMANRNRLYREVPLIHHSDRGIQYCSNAYQKLLKRYRITPSMTESYDPYANAVAERINGILKQEFLLEELNRPLWNMKQVIKEAVYKYNNLRPHYSCEYKTPEYMHHQKMIKIKSYKNKFRTSQRTFLVILSIRRFSSYISSLFLCFSGERCRIGGSHPKRRTCFWMVFLAGEPPLLLL